MKYKVKNIADKINLEPFYIFAKNLSSIRTLKPDLSTNPDVIKITKNYYNEHNNCNYIAFADEKDVKHFPTLIRKLVREYEVLFGPLIGALQAAGR